MCGIAGIFHYRSSQRVDRNILSRMLVRIQHRGPDESGIYLNRNIGLGHVRLSILDLKTGSQPMSDPDNLYWITFNGEIFNYIELRDELIRKGYRFRTTSDTEVLLQLYKECGENCLTNGTFVFASEIKSILEYPGIHLEVSPEALSYVFTFWTTPTWTSQNQTGINL